VPGFLIQQGATVMCAHGGQAMPTVPSQAVALDGMPASAIPYPWTVVGCPGVGPPVPPCVTSYGQPLVIMGGTAVCAPAGTPLLPIVTQVRVTAT